jgi:putative tryptophan/tyrosine transport system substrate-binding protein
MKRRNVVLALAGMCAVPPLRAQPRATARIGYLSLSRVEVDRAWLETFKRTLRELGYVEGRNLVVEQRHALGHADRMPALAAELLKLPVDVLVVYGAWHLAGKLPPSTPLVFTVVPDPVAVGLVPSLARPGGNITGFADNHDSLVPKRLELLKEVVPSVSRVAVLHYTSRMAELQLQTARAAAPALGLSLMPSAIKGPEPEEVRRAFGLMAKEGAQALIIIADATVSANRRLIGELAIKQRLPAIGTVRDWAAAGFLMSYGTNFHELWRRSALYVDKILKGAKAGDLPVEQPTTFDLAVNLKTAKAIGVTVPQSLVGRANEVIG